MKLWNKNFILLLQGAFVSNIGDVLYSFAIGYYVYELTGSEAMLGIFSSITMLGFLLLGPVAGAFADRLDRKGVIVWMDALRGVVMLVIGSLCIMGRLPVGVLMSLTAIISVAGVFFTPAYSSVVVDIVPSGELVRAKSIESSASMIVKLAGRSVSGVLVAVMGVGPLILFNGISFLFSAFSELFINVPYSPKQTENKKLSLIMLGGDLRQGFSVVLHIKGLNVMFVGVLLTNLLFTGIFNLLLVLSLDKGFSIIQHGFIITFFSVGGLLGALLISLVPMSGKLRLLLAFLGFTLMIPLTLWGVWSPSFWTMSLVLMVAAVGQTIGNVVLESALMLLIPEHSRSTVIGIVMASSMGGSALSSIGYGLLVEKLSFQPVATVGLLLSIVPILLLFASAEMRSYIAGNYKTN